MIVHKAFKFRLYPTEEQASALRSTMDWPQPIPGGVTTRWI